VPAAEFVGWRVVLTVPVCLALILATGQGGELIGLLRAPRRLMALALSAALIGGNWLIYVAAIQAGHVLATSLGYYMNPLLNVLLGTLFLGERLAPRQWLAVAVAGAGVAVLASGAPTAMGLSLSLAATFGLYGLVRKLVPVSAITGLTVETLVLLPLGLAVVGWYGAQPAGTSIAQSPGMAALIIAAGPVTALPLLLFAAATRRLPYATIGFIQFLSPTLVFIQGVWLFHEPIDPRQMACFALIWTACAIYCWDLLSRRRTQAA
jgi:chloramphenicol-sensitive protein RarD